MPGSSWDVPTSSERFVTTQWSVVLTARDAFSPGASQALEELCRAYWRPLYCYIRREGHGVAEAQDLTQEFFARVLARDYLNRWDQQRGKFRSFLLGYLKHFLSEQRGKARAKKTGGGVQTVPLDLTIGEEGCLDVEEPADELSPDRAFERQWAQTLLQRTLHRLAKEYDRTGKAALFEALKDFQPRRAGSPGYAQIGARLGMTEAAVKSAVRSSKIWRRMLDSWHRSPSTQPTQIGSPLPAPTSGWICGTGGGGRRANRGRARSGCKTRSPAR